MPSSKIGEYCRDATSALEDLVSEVSDLEDELKQALSKIEELTGCVEDREDKISSLTDELKEAREEAGLLQKSVTTIEMTQ